MIAKIIQMAGAESDIVAISRVCTGKDTEEVSPEDTKRAIFNLIKRRHWSPFEFAGVWIVIEAPIYVMRQWMRHAGAWMEKSRRYTKDEAIIEDVKMPENSLAFNVDAYEEMLEQGDKPEDARKVLPLCTYTKCYWNPNIRDLLHFFRLRLSSHAQSEIRGLTTDLAEEFSKHYPNIWEAFAEYELGEESFSIKQMEAIVEALKSELQSKEIREVLKIAKKRISMVEGVFGGVSPEVGDSTEGGEPTGSTSPDCEEVC